MTVHDILDMAQSAPVTVTEPSLEAAKRWVWQAHNHIRRRAPHLRRLIIARRGNTITIVAGESNDEALDKQPDYTLSS